MLNTIGKCLTVGMLFIAYSLIAQVHVPPMELSVKGGVTNFDMGGNGGNYTYWAPSWQGEIRWNALQYFSIGAFVSQGSARFKYTSDADDSQARYEGGHIAYGGSLRLSTGRKPRFRPFVELSLGKFDMYMDNTSRSKCTGSFVGYSIGLMIKASNRLYVVVPQVNIRARKTYFDFEEPDNFAFGSYGTLNDIQGGLVLNVGKR
jgi:hypothetical protein